MLLRGKIMKFDYLTDESEKSLAPFFSPIILSASFYSVLIVAGLLILCWPWQNLVSFMSKHKVPLVFFQIFTATLITNSYLNLRCGRGEMVKSDYFSSYSAEVSTFEKENDFFQYGLIEFLLHTVFLILPFLPLLILCTSISGLPLTTFVRACAIVFTASLLCRMFGFLMYLFGGRAGFTGYFFSRVFLIVFIFATAVFAPVINPIINIYKLNKSLQSFGLPFISYYAFYLATVTAAILILVLVNQMLVKRHIKIHSHQNHQFAKIT